MIYALRVKFKSNEAPWSGGYEPAARHQPSGDDEAIEWAVDMAAGLGESYLVTLVKDGTVIPIPQCTCDQAIDSCAIHGLGPPGRDQRD